MAAATKGIQRTDNPKGPVDWLIKHPKAFAFGFLGIFVVLAFGISLARPQEAANAIGVAHIVGSFLGIDKIVDEAMSSLLRGAINSCLSLASTILSDSADTSMLTKNFNQVWPTLMPVVRRIHELVAIPIANIVLAVFLVVGLCRYIQKMGQAEAGVDAWSLMLIFVFYSLVKTCIDASFPLMVLTFDMCRNAIEAVISIGGTGAGIVAGYAAVPEDVTGTGWLFLALLVSLIVLLASWLASLVVQLVIYVRMIQVYVYTAFAAIPLSALMSESGRSIATSFIKKYIALLLSGLIIVLLVILYSTIITSVGTTANLASGGEADAIAYLWELLGSTVVSFAMIYCMINCSGWARDLIGC